MTPIPIPPAARLVIAAIERARTCLTRTGLRVSGGPVFPQQSPTSPDGELIVGNGAGGAFVAFYADAGQAQRLEPQVRQNVNAVGNQLVRRGAVTVLFVGHPATQLHTVVLGCAFA